MHYHFNYPYYPAAWQEEDGGGTPIPNGCVTQGTNGTEYGYDTSIPIGANTPDALPSGQAIYANYWLSDGTFIMRFSDEGNKPIPDVEFIFTSINGTLIQYVWDSVELRYQASNLTLATQLISDYVLDEDVCYTALPLLQKFISYDFNLLRNPNAYYKNNTSYSPYFDAVTQGSNHVRFSDGQSVDLPTVASGYATYFDVDTEVFVTTAITDGNPLAQTTSFSSYFTTDVPVTEGDRSYLNTSPEALYAMWFGEPVVGLSFSKANMINFVPGTEGLQGGAYLQDLSVDVGTDATTGYYESNGGQTFTEIPSGHNIVSTISSNNSSRPASGRSGGGNDGLNLCTLTITVNSGIAEHRGSIIGSTTYLSALGKFDIGTYTYTFIAPVMLADTFYTQFSGQSEFVFDIDVTHTVQSLTAYEIANYTYTCRTSYANTSYGASNFALVQDASGRVTGMGLANTQNFPPYDDGRYASTGFKPNIPVYSIEETITGELAVLDVNGDPTGSFTQRTEQRLLTHDAPEIKYYINGIEQATTALPDPDTNINLNDTAVIGYPDTIESREAYFNVHSEVIVP